MILKNSYIFLEHPNKKKEFNEEKDSNVIFLRNNIYSFVKKEFPYVKEKSSPYGMFQTKLDYIMNENKLTCSVSFIISIVDNVTYLDVIVSDNSYSKLISCLEFIQNKLFNSGLRKHFVEIVSYDAISEYYCNKAFSKLNSLERNLRKLLFNIYIFHFGEDYYVSTIDSALQDKIKGVIRSNNAKDYHHKIRECYGVDAEQSKTIIRLQQFFYSLEFVDIKNLLFTQNWTPVDKEELEDFLNKHKNLSLLSDEELRNNIRKISPKSDWERFFCCKIKVTEIEKTIDQIRKYRNTVAHLKFFYKDDYIECNKLILKLNKAILKSIKITEEKDFVEKNAKNLYKSFINVTIKMGELFKSVREYTMNSHIESLQAMKKVYGQIRESVTTRNIVKAILQSEKYFDFDKGINYKDE